MIPPNATFRCSSCSMLSSSEAALDQHIDGPHPYRCTLCKTHYVEIDHFRSHLEQSHTGYMCPARSCPYWSDDEQAVKQHMSVHELAGVLQQGRDAVPLRPANAGRPSRLRNGKPKADAPFPWYQWKYPCHHLPWYILEQFLRARFPSETFEKFEAGDHWIVNAPEKMTDKDRADLAALRFSQQTLITHSRVGPESIYMLPCPFGLHLGVSSSPKNQQPACQMLYANITNLIFHLSTSAHGIDVTSRTLSSFDFQSGTPPVQKAGVCRNCWKTFGTARELSSHISTPCSKTRLTTLDIHGILCHAFARNSPSNQRAFPQVPLGRKKSAGEGNQGRGHDAAPEANPSLVPATHMSQTESHALEPPPTGDTGLKVSQAHMRGRCAVRDCEAKAAYKTFGGETTMSTCCKLHTCRAPLCLLPTDRSMIANYCEIHQYVDIWRQCGLQGCPESGWTTSLRDAANVQESGENSVHMLPWYCVGHECEEQGCTEPRFKGMPECLRHHVRHARSSLQAEEQVAELIDPKSRDSPDLTNETPHQPTHEEKPQEETQRPSLLEADNIDRSIPARPWDGASSTGYTESWCHPRKHVQAVAAQTDSGYASLPREKRLEPCREQTETDTRADDEKMAEDDGGDINTIYSDDRSHASVSRTQRYISEFVDHLFGKVKRQLQDYKGVGLEDCLPELLQAFALKVGQCSSDRGHLEVMYFVHRHRRAITLSLQNRLEENEGHGSAETQGHGADASGMSVEDILSLWARKTSAAEPDHETDEMGTDALSEIEFLEDEVDLNEMYRYQSLITESSAFDWLVGSLQRELQSATPTNDGMMHIRRRILQGLPTPRHISRKQAVPPVQVTFTAPWDPVSFIEEQDYDQELASILGKVITLTGSADDVQATTCAQYLCETWPSIGKHMLRIVEDAVSRSEASTGSAPERRTYIMPDNTRIIATWATETLTLEATGTAYSMAEIGEQLGWLISALRSSPQEASMAVFCPSVERFQQESGPSGSFSCRITTYEMGQLPFESDLLNGKCWHDMFRNPVVVWGYPIPRRQGLEKGTGLEIPLDILVALTDACGVSEFNDKTFIKGYSAMLIPTRQVDNLILWHLTFNRGGSRISYTDCRIEALAHIRPAGLKQARHILGWISHARNNTGSPHANYDIKWSGLGKPRERHAWEKVVISGGDPVGVSASFVIGKKDKGIFTGALTGYASRLKFISKQYVVLYDLDDRRAWLVDGLSALLHLVRASLNHDQKDVFKPYFLYHQGQMKECATVMHGSAAAAAVLFSPENCSLRLYTESEDTWDEETEQQKHGAHGPETVKETVSKRRVTYYCLRDRVLEMFATLEKMIDHLNNVVSENGVGFRLRGTPRNLLEGFDFMDVATSNAPIRPHMIKLNVCESGRGWTDLLRSIQAVTLFGKGFGELIAPATDSQSSPACGGCGYGISLPMGKDYLGTCVDLVERILTTRGSTETVPWCLADDIYWHTPGPLFDPCECASATRGTKPNSRVQVLLPSTFNPKIWGRSFASPNELHSKGAIMFSHNWRMPFRLGHQTSQDQKMLDAPDSGLGTSIDSSPARSQLSGSSDDTETQVSDAADLAARLESGGASRKRKLVDMVVDRVKRKVLKTSADMELGQVPSGGNGGP